MRIAHWKVNRVAAQNYTHEYRQLGWFDLEQRKVREIQTLERVVVPHRMCDLWQEVNEEAHPDGLSATVEKSVGIWAIVDL
jgi:hypothetical protein